MTRLLRSPAAWALALIIAAGAAVSGPDLSAYAGAAPVSVGVGLLISATVTGIAAALVRRSRLWDRHGAAVALALAWGALAAPALIILCADQTDDLMARLGWDAIADSVSGAWPEEIAKDLGVALISIAWWPRMRRPGDGLIIGLFCGLGFELIETLIYGAAGALAHPSSDLAGALDSWRLRELGLGAGLHAICTAIAGRGLTTAMATGRRRHGVLGVVAGFALHFAWNADWPQSWAQPALGVVYVVGLVALVVCWRSALRSCPPRSRAGGPDGPPHPGGSVPLGENAGREGAQLPAGAR
ncbi:PrsW family intramembrane metalloprotease [uncultured Actinomyces sp.]|uniref:PrsW family intramembrane metalloprotease n=1 Tax=uncultured Actinomyces sp. TaxID=249061 RepID=UPI00288A2D24|nr:PrsW family intramembrane metalloprotease [uncultured Actinomyces sp.]